MVVLTQQAFQQTSEIKLPQWRIFICRNCKNYFHFLDPLLYFDHNGLFHSISIIQLTYVYCQSNMGIQLLQCRTQIHTVQVPCSYELLFSQRLIMSPPRVLTCPPESARTQTRGHSAQLYTYLFQSSCYMFWLQTIIFRK